MNLRPPGLMNRPAPAAGATVGANDCLAEVEDTRHRYFDRALGMTVVNVFQGDYYITSRRDEVLTTVLGSCIAACIRDPVIGYGGMNHFLLPQMGGDVTGPMSASLRYGSFAMEQLINEILRRGGRRERLEVKVFGGGNVMAGLSGVGHKNADFIEEFLRNEGLAIAGMHLRGNRARKVQYMPGSGKVRMREVGTSAAQKLATKEVAQNVKVIVAEDTGAIELFD